MSICRGYQEMIEDYLAENIPPGDRAELAEHCAICSQCAGVLEMHQNLAALGAKIPLPEKSELRDMREAVLAATGERQGSTERSGRQNGFLTDLGYLWRAYPLANGLATAAVLVCAVFLGRWNPQDNSFEADLLRQSSEWSATRQASLDDYWDSPFSFANVSVRPRGQGQLALSFDASRHVDLQVAQDSPLAREVLLHAIMAPSSFGSRLQAMEVAPQLRDELLKEALVTTMLNDPDPTVRINALAVLAQYPFDQRSEAAFIQTLRQDQDVQMRLTVLEELVRRNVNQEIIRDAVGQNDPDGTMAYLHQASLKF
jgi:hypothetical protein